MFFVVFSELFVVWNMMVGFPEWLNYLDRAGQLVNRVLALLFVAWVYFFQKELFVVSRYQDERPSPWIPGILSIVVGASVYFLIIFEVVFL